MARVFLAVSALVWLPYGIFCFLQPGYLAEAAGEVSGYTAFGLAFEFSSATLAMWLLSRESAATA
jgi:hypothetical protein